MQLSGKAGGADATAEDADRLSELAAFTGGRRSSPPLATSDYRLATWRMRERPAYGTLAA